MDQELPPAWTGNFISSTLSDHKKAFIARKQRLTVCPRVKPVRMQSMRLLNYRRRQDEVFFLSGAILIFSTAMMTVMYYAMRWRFS